MEMPTSEKKMPRRIHHVHGTPKHRNMQSTDQAEYNHVPVTHAR